MPTASTAPLLLCALPAQRAALATQVADAGGVALIDLTTASGPVPAGAWVRVRSGDSVPGTGPVVLAAGSPPTPVPGRETWLETTQPIATPHGFAGIVLRGEEAGGPCGARPGLELLGKVPSGTRVLLDSGVLPSDLPRAGRAEGVVLSDVLLGLPELQLPPALRARMALADAAGSHVINGFRVESGPLGPVVRKLLSGASFWDLAQGHFAADDPRERAWPAGLALRQAPRLAAEFGGLTGLLSAYRAAVSRGGSTTGQPDAVAIIGLGCRLPGANSIDQFWDNLVSGRSSIVEVPVERWDPALFWDPDKRAPDRTYAKIGGFLTDFSFNPRRFRIPPFVAKSVDQVQQTALESAADALQDAGYKVTARDSGREFDRQRTAVILGNSMGGEVTDDYVMRVRVPAIRQALSQVPGFASLPEPTRAGILEAFEAQLVADLPPITEDSMPGELSNVIAGRVANALDLSGANFTVDAACASSMAAVQTAVKGLLDGDFDMAITGGADRSMGVATYTKFCKIGALSPDHSAPFDQTANGFVMGEGCGILVLKRLSDARRDGDRVYAVVKGIGASSDGKGKGITAPNPVGQRLALRRAYDAAGIDPAEVDLIEAHGTSTVVGDKVEVESLTEIIGAGRRGDRGPVRLGSVKSNIGHLKSAAGAASLIKASLAIHNGVLPPSINFKNAREDVDFASVPLQVQGAAEPWPAGQVRRAGVSAFGFGGTNFHVVLEQDGVVSQSAEAQPAPAARPAATHTPVPEGVWAVSADSRAELLDVLRAVQERGFDATRAFEPNAPVRITAALGTPDELQGQLDRAIKVLTKDRSADLLRARGIYLEEEPVDGKVAFLFTGQGSQYIDMGLDLAEHYAVVASTFAEADRVMLPELGRPLTDFIRRNPALEEAAQFEALRATEISQPATLTVDVAILRLLAAFGVSPDMVAGHSLGEYAAAVAAGMLSFEDALLAVSARGREMASVQIDDPGRMAGIATNERMVSEVLAEIPGYVVAANKNCPTQTVIAGESDAVEAAIEAFRSRGVTVYPLPVSHAFHSRIVAPASGPLKKVLERLQLGAPKRPVTTNVTSGYYPTGPDAAAKAIDILARQVAAPVEWIAQLERMYSDGARVFVECGPKRALSGFAVSTFKRRPHRALYTNHPKRGGLASFRDALAALVALGMPVTPEPSAGPIDLFFTPEPRRATTAAIQARQAGPDRELEASAGVFAQVAELVAELTGYAASEMAPEDELEADLGVDTVKQAELVARIRDRLQLDHDPDFRLSDHRTLRDLAVYAARRLGAMRTRPVAAPAARAVSVSAPAPAVQPVVAAPAPGVAPTLPPDALAALVEGAVRAGLDGAAAQGVASAVAPALQSLVTALVAATAQAQPPAPAPAPPPAPVPAPAPALPHPARAPREVVVVATGASVGLPGGTELFSDDNIPSVLRGDNRIDRIDDAVQDRILGQNIVRLVKDPKTGQGTFVKVDQRQQVIHLAGVRRKLDVVADYGINAKLVQAIDITTQMAFAAALEALRDAGIPLVRTFRETKSGKRVATGWALPESLRDGTGVVFCSAFPGYTQLMSQLQERWHDHQPGDEPPAFDRRFLFQVLSMGHSQLAQLIGARGPNTQVNAACASTTQGIAVAQDWLRLGRAERVLVVGADDVTNDVMLPWIGAGFLAAGAATTKDKVEEAALPFDRRRHGMILGAGAVGLVLEREADVRARGQVPLARLLATRIANSAFHGTRLDRDHIAGEVDKLVGEASAAAQVTRDAFARSAVFMSHETYTPAKGGSAAAEIDSLRHAFGDAAKHVVVTNTKGFTGHPMGAGIEDAIVLKALQHGQVPPIPNLKEPDPDLGELTLSQGGPWSGRFALRLAAGFGSQVALAAWEKVAEGLDRTVDEAAHRAWLAELGAGPAPRLVIEDRTLKLVEGEPAEAVPVKPPPAAASSGPLSAAGANASGVLAVVTRIIAEKTGYGADELDPEYELEADLGIDTVKQAEIFSDVREKLGVAQDPEFRLADYPTIRALSGWLAERADAPAQAAAPVASPPGAPEAVPAPSAAPSADVLAVLTSIIAEKTGYEPSELDPEYELEADLGIDTVKQAEIFSDVREKLGVAQDPEFRLADYPTLQALAGWLAARRSSDAQAVEAAPEPAAAPAPAAGPAADDVDVLAILTGIVAEKTGYEPSELDPEYELEADLGIDTVKQAEIFSDVREKLGVAQDPEFRLADYPTLQALAGWLAARRSSDSPVEEAVSEPEAAPAPPPAASVPPPAAPPTEEDRTLPASFRLRRPVVTERPPAPSQRPLSNVPMRVLGEGPFAVALRAAAEQGGAVLDSTRPALVIDAGAEVEASFELARRLDGDRPARWVCATRLGADPSWVDPAVGMVQGARAGFAKALGQEWAHTSAAVVDVDPMLEDAEAARAVLSEALAEDGLVEVYLDGERRRAVGLVVEEPPAQGSLRDGAVVVLTGGTRGVTAKVAVELARRGPVKLALLARTPPAAKPLDEAAAKASIKAELKAGGERGTPAQIERRLAPLRRADEARANVAAMEALGAEVRFYSVDLADEDAVRAVLEQVRVDLGYLDGVIHGAGIEESRLLADKTEADFARVFSAKALGGMTLVRNLERTAWFVSMGSVAGRFGNAGQVDYAAANEAMARVCLSRPRSLHVDWTAWGDVGMAVRGGMERLLTDRGVEMLPSAAGAALLVDLIVAGATGEVMVSGRLGALSPASAHPLLDRHDFDGDALLGIRTLSVERDPWLLDHSIGGTAVLPGVVGLELMAAVAAQVLPGEPLVGAEDVQFAAPVKVHAGREVTVIIRAEKLDDDEVRCTLRSERASRTGRMLVVEHFSAVLRFGDPDLVATLPPAFFPEEPIEQGAIYRRFFHGPAFQVLEEAEAVFSSGCVAVARVDHGPLGAGLLTGPLLLEAALQTAGLHGMAVRGRMGLPQAIDLVRFDSVPADGDEISVVAQERDGKYDVDVDGPDGSVLRVRGLTLVDTGPLPDGDRFPVPDEGWPEAIVSTASSAPGGGPVALLASEVAAMTARGTPRRQADRLAGQRAAKAAVGALLGLPGEAFTVERLPSGQPEARMAAGTPAAASVSVSHREGRGWAVATRRGRAGLDVEAVALRAPSFARTWFTVAEQAATLGDPTAETEVWCVKEAVLKALGRGMALHPREVEVTRHGGHRASVVLHGEAHATWQAGGAGGLTVHLGRLDGLVAAAALWTPGQAVARSATRSA